MIAASEETREHRVAARPAAPAPRRRRRLASRIDLPLAAIVLLAFAMSAWFTAQVTNWVVMSDELQHSKLGLNITREGTLVPHLHGEVYSVYTMLYPLIAAPLYALLAMPEAFRGVHLLNSALMASTAIPAYLLAREALGSKPMARIAAALTVAVPWMGLSTMVLTENAAYPAFTWALLAMYKSIAAPSIRHDLLAVAAIVLAFFARTQFAVLVGVFPLAVLVHELGFAAMAPRAGRGRIAELRDALRRMVSEHRALVVIGVVVVAIAIPLALAGQLRYVLGAYEDTANTATGSFLPPGMPRSMALHLTYVAVGCGILSLLLALAWSAGTIVRPTSRRLHAFAVLGIGIVLSLTGLVASFMLRFVHGGISDRYAFYIAPVLFIGMLAFFTDVRRRWIALLVSSLATAKIISVAQFTQAGGPFFDTPASAFHQVIYGRTVQLGSLLGFEKLEPKTFLPVLVILAAIALAAIGARVAARRLGLAVGLAVLVTGVAQTVYVMKRMTFEGGATVPTLEGRNWIDERVGPGTSVAMLPSQEGTYQTQGLWWETEFWNKSVERVLRYQASTTYTPFPYWDVAVDPRSGEVTVASEDRTPYIVSSLSEPRFGFAGRTIAEQSGLRLQRPSTPWRAAWISRGVQPNDGMLLSGRASLRVFGHARTPRRLAVRLSVANGAPAWKTRRYELSAGAQRVGDAVPALKRRRSTLEVCVPAGGFRDVAIRFGGNTPHGAAPGIEPVLVGLTVAAVDVSDRGRCQG